MPRKEASGLVEEVGSEVRQLTDCVELLAYCKNVDNLVDVEMHHPAPFQGKTGLPTEGRVLSRQPACQLLQGLPPGQTCLYGGYALPSAAEIWLLSKVGG